MLTTETIKLVKKLRKGNVSAFDLIFKIYNQKVFNFCLKLLNKQEDAEEVTQEVFIALWENREKIELNTSLSSYIYRIARNKIYNIYRKSYYVQAYLEYMNVNSKKLESFTEDEILYNELNQFLNVTIEALPPRRKEVFELSRFEGLTYKEIAKRMKISENTVDVQIRKALGFLRNAFKNYYLI
jgi:RNA polymerase sigma-70 factor, ECF subfamily